MPDAAGQPAWVARSGEPATVSSRAHPDERNFDYDTLPNWLEDFLGTNRYNPDTDGDGITDSDEHFVTNVTITIEMSGQVYTVGDSLRPPLSIGRLNFNTQKLQQAGTARLDQSQINQGVFCMRILSSGHVIAGYLGLLLIGCSDSVSETQDTKIGTMLSQLVRSGHGIHCGWEQVTSLNENVRVSPDWFKITDGNLMLQQASSAINKSPDYACRVKGLNLVVYPKPNDARFNEPLVVRRCRVPPLNNTDISTAVKLMAGSDGSLKLFNIRDSTTRSEVVSGVVTLDAMDNTASEVLFQFSRQIHANYWSIAHLYQADVNGNPDWPINLGAGFISFYHAE